MRCWLVISLAAIVVIAPLAVLADTAIPADAWKGKQAMDDIAAQLTFGPRAMDTAGHEKTVQYIENELGKTKAATIKGQQWIDYGDKTGLAQTFLGAARTGKGSTQHAMVNIVARFYPDNPRRIIVGTHYDSIIRAYRDKEHPEATMPGANNSASGVALLLETERVLSTLPTPPVGIDFVFFDGEEGPKSLGEGDREWRPLGSPYFTQHLEDFYPNAKPEQAVLFDMVCYKNLELNPEQQSLTKAKPETDKFWRIGAEVAPEIFKQDGVPYPISDDHDAFNKAGIPAFLVIDFKYDPWFNTTQDTIDKCSAASLEAVGRTLLQYIYAM
jgi:glutaminyl-peptide cyclotransferase